jgi:glucose/mannose-6-phosphate isomerase
MIDLSNLDEIKKLDPKNVYGSTELFVDQCEQIWADAQSMTFPEEYKDFENIILCGMGGSAYAGYVIQSLFKNSLKIPFYSNNDYDLPIFANEKSLIILSSYSGTTEESLSCGQEAIEKGLKITGITNGGKLTELLKSHNLPFLQFDPKNNPSGQPRLGTGYMVLGTIALLVRAGLLKIDNDEVEKAINEVKENMEKTKNEAINLAKEIVGFSPVIMSCRFLNGNAHVMRNQFNETAKTFSAFEDIPELNHHLMEGLKYPENNKLAVLFLKSNLYENIYQKRIALTDDVIKKNNIKSLYFEPSGTTELSQVLTTLVFGGYVTLYLAFLYNLDPSLIPWVDYFKDQLKK